MARGATTPRPRPAYVKASARCSRSTGSASRPRLRKCLGSTNLIDSTHSGVRQKTRSVTNWKNGAMALRWAAASFVETEKSYRRIIGYDQLWMLRAHLDDHEPVAEMRKAG